MPSWKKVITSGSAAALSSLNVTGGITGSSVLISGSTGTLFSSNVDTLVLTGSLLVTGSTVLSGSLSVTQGITGSLFGTSSWAVSASWAPVATTVATASFVTASNVYGPFGSNSIISASFAVSSSRAVTSSFALTSSYASNGGVTQLLAGPNISLSPTNGLGQVTISSLSGSGGGGFNTATGSYGSFYDTTTQTNPVANTPRSMSLNTTAITNGVSVSGSTNPFNTYIKTENAGVYDIQFSAQLDKTDSGTDEVVIWLRKNGTDLTDTATTITLNGNNDKQVAAWNWFVNSAANDYYQIIWYSADTDLRLLAEAAGGGHPGIPSLIVTVNRVDQFLSNTGSFSGSFTGQFTGSLFGTASFATSASFASTASFLNSTTNAFLQNGNSFGTTALLGTNDNQSLALETNGTTRMFISSSGNVGINTTSPDTAVHISGDSNTTIKISTTGSSGGDQDIRFNRLGVETWTLGRDNTLNDFRLSYAANNVGGLGSGDLLTVKGTGNVGIGTTSPGFRLSVSASSNSDGIQVIQSGTSRIELKGDGTAVWGSTADFGRLTYDTGKAILQAQSGKALSLGANNLSDHLYINTSGNVGINTTSPLYSLDVVGNIRAYTTLIRRDTSAGSAFINYNESASGYWSVGMSASSYSYDVIDANYGINKLSITNGSTWGVGIGTTAPGAKLDVRGSTYIRNDNTTNQLTIDNDSVGTNASPQYSDILFGGYSTALRARIRGVDRASNTTIGGLILQSSTDGTTLVDRLFLNGNGESYFYNNSSEVMRIDSTGNVGIGKTTPGARLDVSGSAIISGSFTVTPGTVREFQVRTAGVDIGNLITDTHTVTGSLSVSGSITGSLFGTASFALTSSFLNSTTNAFIQNGNSFGTTALLGTNDNNSLALETSGSTRMFISSSGNVGIGTTTPSASLDVVGGNIVINYQSNYGSRNSINNIVPLIEVGVGSMSGASQSNLYKAGYSNTNGFEIGTAAAVGIYGIDNDGTNVRTFGILTNNVRRLTIDSTGSLRVNGNTTITGSLTVSQSLLQYSNVTAVTSGSTSNVASFSTGSYTAAFFDYVTTSGTNARAGSVFTVWNGNSVEYTETSTNDIGSTSNLLLSASVTAGAVRLQATSLSGSWSVKTLARML